MWERVEDRLKMLLLLLLLLGLYSEYETNTYDITYIYILSWKAIEHSANIEHRSHGIIGDIPTIQIDIQRNVQEESTTILLRGEGVGGQNTTNENWKLLH